METVLDLPQVTVNLIADAHRSYGIMAKLDDDTLRWIETRYLKFLLLQKRHWGTTLVPTEDVDEMWHLHMLRPRAYAEDCQKLFGTVLDHNGGFGAEADQTSLLIEFFEHTSKLWEIEYEEPYVPKHVPRGVYVGLRPNGVAAETANIQLDSRVVAKAWSSPSFRQELFADPKTAISRETGITLPAHLKVSVVEETPDHAYLVLPARPHRLHQDLDAPLINSSGLNMRFGPVNCCSTLRQCEPPPPPPSPRGMTA